MKYDDYDQIWAVVRSLKNGNPHFKHVPELSPSWGLFKKYLQLKKEGNWNQDAFFNIYLPQFINEMRSPIAKKKLAELINLDAEGYNICLFCFCQDEKMCHRSILGHLLKNLGANVDGLADDTIDSLNLVFENQEIKIRKAKTKK